MEIIEDANLFPTEVQEAVVSHQDIENTEQKISQENPIFDQNIEIPQDESIGHQSNSDNNNNEIQAEENKINDLLNNISQNLTNNTVYQNPAENTVNNKPILTTFDGSNKKHPRTCPQTAQKHSILYKRTMNIKKPNTTSSKSSLLTTKGGKISSLSADKYLPSNLKNNPIIAKKYGIYTPSEIIARPPRVALDSREYNPKPPTELSDLAQSILDGKLPDKEASKEELRIAKNQLKNLELELIDKSDYMEAKKAAAAFDYMEKYINRQQNVSKLKENLEGLLSKRNELVAYVTSIQESIKAQLEEQKLIADGRLKELENQQTIEIQEFDDNVPAELTKEFRHQTKDYLDLRIKQRSLALKREFDEAQKMKEKADKIEQLQIKGDIKKMRKYYNRKRKLILSKHRIQIQCLIDDNFLREKEIINSRQFEIDSTNARIAALDDEVKRKCEEKGVNMSDLDDTLVDQQRVDDLISRSNETRYAKFRPRSNYSGSCYTSLRQPLPPLSVEA